MRINKNQPPIILQPNKEIVIQAVPLPPLKLDIPFTELRTEESEMEREENDTNESEDKNLVNDASPVSRHYAKPKYGSERTEFSWVHIGHNRQGTPPSSAKDLMRQVKKDSK